MTPTKKFFKKNRTLILLVAILVLLLAIFIPVELKDKRVDNSKTDSDKKSNSLPPVIVSDTRNKVDVPILMYHHIRIYNNSEDKIGTNLSVSPENFKSQIDYLKSNGYTTISFSDLLNYPSKKLPDKPVIITFDDGYNDAYTNAFSLLKQNGQIGVFYVISGFLGRPDFMTASQVKELSDNNMEIGSHTVDHPSLITLSPTKLSSELIESKNSLEAIISKPVTSFCYPSGKNNTTVDDAVKTAGYLSATTTYSAISNTSEDKYILPRLRINSTDSLKSFIDKILNK